MLVSPPKATLVMVGILMMFMSSLRLHCGGNALVTLMMTVAEQNLEVQHVNGCQSTPLHGRKICGLGEPILMERLHNQFVKRG